MQELDEEYEGSWSKSSGGTGIATVVELVGNRIVCTMYIKS